MNGAGPDTDEDLLKGQGFGGGGSGYPDHYFGLPGVVLLEISSYEDIEK